MFVSADILVKAVMIGLAFASLVTWTVWLAKTIELLVGTDRLRRALVAISAERSLIDARARVALKPETKRASVVEIVPRASMTSMSEN